MTRNYSKVLEKIVIIIKIYYRITEKNILLIIYKYYY